MDNAFSVSGRKDQHFSGAIDWNAATPSWFAILTGAVLPGLGILGLVALVDLALGALLRRWFDVPLWLLAAILVPLALAGTIALACVRSLKYDEPIQLPVAHDDASGIAD